LAVGKQDETVIVHWRPGETAGVDGSGITAASIPTGEDFPTASGVRSFVDARIDLLKAKVIASGVVATYAG
jgi:hypothetical protein